MTSFQPSPMMLGMTKKEFIAKYEKDWGLTVEWTTGGITGGSCWGGSPDSAVEADPEPEFEILDKILEAEAPTATFLEYRRMMKDPNIVTTRTWEDREYYGNYYSKASKSLNLEALWPYVEVIMNIPDPSVRASHYKLVKD